MTDKEKLKAKLIIFLENNGALEKFMDNLEDFKDIDSLCENAIRNQDKGKVISSAFSWSSTAEGSAYWVRLYELFSSSYDDIPTDGIPTYNQWDNMWDN